MPKFWGTLLIACAVAQILFMSAGAQERSLTVTSWGGSTQEAERKAFFQPYQEKTGIIVREDSWRSEMGKIRAMVEAKAVTWDLVVADYAHAIEGCEQGLLVPIPADVVGDKNDYLKGMLHECGVGIDVFAYVFAYDESRVPKEWGSDRPKTIKDIWDVKRFPGKRGFRKDAKRTLEQALMADDVPPAEVYKVLATPEGLKRALAKLDQIREHSIFWQSMAQAPQLLADGEVTIVTAPNSRIESAIKEGRNFKVIWDGQLFAGNIVIVPKGPKASEAFALLKYILQPDVLWRQTQYIPYAPSRFSAQKNVDEKVLIRLPTHPDNLKNSLSSNEEFWADNYQEYLRVFNNWLAK